MRNSEDDEIELLVQAILKRYGYDFTNYSPASLGRRVRATVRKLNLSTITDLTKLVIHDPASFPAILNGLTVNVTEMFRDPHVYQYIKNELFPYLRTYPELKIWHAGCATGEEVYSLAILLAEADLYSRSLIYATDINAQCLAKAREGIFSEKAVAESTDNYLAAGGLHSLSRYYTARYGSALINGDLKKNVVFADHNLVTDGKFGEMNLILCRNVLIYFNPSLQMRVMNLLWESLTLGGFLCLGAKERMDCSKNLPGCHILTKQERIYQKKVARE